MAHECPECYMTCYCNGDIDDLCMPNDRYCKHCEHLYDDDYSPYDDYPDED